jgi:hypothetical protein
VPVYQVQEEEHPMIKPAEYIAHREDKLLEPNEKHEVKEILIMTEVVTSEFNQVDSPKRHFEEKDKLVGNKSPKKSDFYPTFSAVDKKQEEPSDFVPEDRPSPIKMPNR